MMSSTRLILDFDNRKVPHTYDGNAFDFCVNASVRTLSSIPESMWDCLVVQAGSSSQDERIVRVAEYADIYGAGPGQPLSVLPETVSRFTSTSVALPVGVLISVQAPAWWQTYFGVPATHEFQVLDSIGTVDVPFPAFARGLRFSIAGGPLFLDGVASRFYPTTYCRTRDHYSRWDDYDGANNRYVSMSAEAQALVDAYNSDTFTKTSEQVFT